MIQMAMFLVDVYMHNQYELNLYPNQFLALAVGSKYDLDVEIV